MTVGAGSKVPRIYRQNVVNTKGIWVQMFLVGVWCSVVWCDVVCAFACVIIMINQFTVHPDCLQVRPFCFACCILILLSYYFLKSVRKKIVVCNENMSVRTPSIGCTSCRQWIHLKKCNCKTSL